MRTPIKRILFALVASVCAIVATAAPASAITFGQPDGNRHHQTGALIAEYRTAGVKQVLCSGSLIAPQVFLTAAHCTYFLASIGVTNVWVTFDPHFTSGSTLIHGSYVTDPRYTNYKGPNGASNPNDLAVVLLDQPVTGVTPAQLPAAGLLNRLDLRNQTITAVGYGTVRDIKQTGPNAFYFDSTRRFVFERFRNLLANWVDAFQNPSLGTGGTCYGDSGGPHFLGGVTSNLEVAITVTGDTACRATDKDYRLDTPSARWFLGQYVTLP
jgi:secreted trypsin-like serine protease